MHQRFRWTGTKVRSFITPILLTGVSQHLDQPNFLSQRADILRALTLKGLMKKTVFIRPALHHGKCKTKGQKPWGCFSRFLVDSTQYSLSEKGLIYWINSRHSMSRNFSRVGISLENESFFTHRYKIFFKRQSSKANLTHRDSKIDQKLKKTMILKRLILPEQTTIWCRWDDDQLIKKEVTENL